MKQASFFFNLGDQRLKLFRYGGLDFLEVIISLLAYSQLQKIPEIFFKKQRKKIKGKQR